MQTRVKELWAEDKPVLNGWLSIGNPFTAEIMGAQGYDALTLDLQHGALDYSGALPMMQALKAAGVTIGVRVPWLDPAMTMKALDAGAMMIICPMINTAEQAAEFVSYMRYPPLGQRSFGPTRAAVAMPGYGTQANAHVIALAMIETAQGMENLDAIAATPGLDGIYVGPSDLTLGTQAGRLPAGIDREEPEMIAQLEQIAKVCASNGIAACIHCGTPDYAARAVGWGYRMTTVSGDSRLLAAAAADSVAAFRNLTGGEAGQSDTSKMY